MILLVAPAVAHFLFAVSFVVGAFTADRIKPRAFVQHLMGEEGNVPKLILIGGAAGTGKSTFGMSVALDQNILKCISTDTVRAVMRSYIPEDICPALHRSSYAPSSEDGSDDAAKSWKETCKCLESSVDGLVEDAIRRRVSLVLEGVSIAPSAKWIEKWEAAGGTACGVLLMVSKEDVHRSLLLKRGFITGNEGAEQQKIEAFDRVRAIQAEMVRLAQESDWLLIEQKTSPDPLEVVQDKLLETINCLPTSPHPTGAAAAAAADTTAPKSGSPAASTATTSIDGTRTSAGEDAPDGAAGGDDQSLWNQLASAKDATGSSASSSSRKLS